MMAALLHALLVLAAAGLAVPAAVVLVQVLMSLGRKPSRGEEPAARPVVAVLVPAHNEAAGIGRTLACIAAQLKPGDRMLVVADNCTDDTAEVARGQGAEVCVRKDPVRRGKGYALDFGVRFLAAEPPDVVIVIDADSLAEEGAIDMLACRAMASRRPVQASYLMHSPARDKLSGRIAEFAWLVKNLVRPLGWHRLGLPCQLMGTGMAFPWELISTAALANGHLVEDMKLGVELAAIGHPPLFCPEAAVTSSLAGTAQGVRSQRSRWEHGHLSVIASEVPGLLLKSVKNRDVRLLALALDLMVPPLALLVLAICLMLLAAGLVFVWTGLALAFALTSASALALGAAVVLAWRKFGRAVVRPGDLPLAIVYAIAKIPLYVRFVVSKQVDWVRTDRK